ncbi:MAG: hypothetical protein SPE23_00640 [Sodaliphilus sp.]|nr:hypothetical protein [Sodaliphilus sp.]
MVNNKTWGVAFGKFYGVTYSILIVNGNLLTHWKHAEGMSLRYGVVEFVDFFCEWCTLLYNIKEAGSFCGGTCFVGVCVWATPYLVVCL